MEKKINRYIVGFLSCFICLIGVAVFIDGMVIRFTTGFFGSEAVKLLNKIKYNHIQFGYLLSAHAYGMIIFGGFVTLKGVLGLVTAVKYKENGIRGFVGMIIVMIVIQAAISGFWISLRGRTDEWLKGQMLDLLGEYRGPQETDDASKGWNKIFMQARCCGVIDQFANGDSTGDFQDSDSVWYNTNANGEKIPATCCQGVDDDDISSTINTACTTTPKDYYTEGCYGALVDLIDLHSSLFFCAAGTLLILQMLAILGACMLIDRGSRVLPMNKLDRPPTPLVKGGDKIMKTKFSKKS